MTQETGSLKSFTFHPPTKLAPVSKRDDAFINWQTKYEASNPIPEEELSPRTHKTSGAMELDHEVDGRTQMSASFSLFQ